MNFDGVISTLFSFVLREFNRFWNIIYNVKVLNVSIVWWFISLTVLSVLFQILFIRFSDDED